MYCAPFMLNVYNVKVVDKIPLLRIFSVVLELVLPRNNQWAKRNLPHHYPMIETHWNF